MRKCILCTMIILTYIFRFFTGNIYGIFLLLSTIYFLVPLFTDIKFLTFSELILTLDSTPDDFKSLIISSMLTIIGFLIAFQSATKNWKDQLQANMRLEASRDIDHTFNRATHLINQIKIYSDQFIKLGNKVESHGITNETHFGIIYISQQGQKFIQDRNELSNINISVQSMYGRYATILLSYKNSLKNLHLAIKHISSVTDKMWILIPSINPQSNTPDKDFLRYYDYNQLESLSKQCEISSQAISGLAGNVTGQLNSKIMDFNFWFVFSFIKLAPHFIDMQRSISRGETINGGIIEKIEKNI